MSETTINLIIIAKKKKNFSIIMYATDIVLIIFFIWYIYVALMNSWFRRLYAGILGIIIAPILLYVVIRYNINHTPTKLIIDENGFKIFYKSLTRSIGWIQIDKIDYFKEFNEKIMRLHLKTNDIVIIPVSPTEDIQITSEIQKYSQIKFIPYLMPR